MLNNETGGLHSYFVTDIQSDEKKKRECDDMLVLEF